MIASDTNRLTEVVFPLMQAHLDACTLDRREGPPSTRKAGLSNGAGYERELVPVVRVEEVDAPVFLRAVALVVHVVDAVLEVERLSSAAEA